MGIPEESHERVFDPLFTTKGVGFGTGLGLPACRTIVNALEGELTFRSEPRRACLANGDLDVSLFATAGEAVYEM